MKLSNGIRFTYGLLLALIVGIAVMSFVVFSEITRKTKIHGILVPKYGSVSVVTPQAGVIAYVFVKDGDYVAANQSLFAVQVGRQTSLGDIQALSRHSLEQRRNSLLQERQLSQFGFQQQAKATADRLKILQDELGQAETETASLVRRLTLTKDTANRLKELSAAGFMSEIQARQKEEESIDIESRLNGSRRIALGIRKDIGSIASERNANNVSAKAQLLQSEKSAAILDQEAAEGSSKDRIIVNSPQPGRIRFASLRQGNSVDSNTMAALVEISQPADSAEQVVSNTKGSVPLIATLYAPSRAAGFVQRGQSVLIRIAAFPYQKFGQSLGRIIEVGESPTNPQDLPLGQGQALLAANQANEPLYKIDVELSNQTITAYGVDHPLKSGMAIEGYVLQERRAMWEWIMEPLIAKLGRTKTQ